MDEGMQGWRTIADEEHGYAVRLPDVTPTGQQVRISVEKRARMHRVHAASPDESELYFELISYAELIDHRKAVADQRAFLLGRCPTGALTPPEQSLWGSRGSTDFLFEGQLEGKFKVRRFRFVDSATRTFRVVYDPTSKLNEKVLERLVVRD